MKGYNEQFGTYTSRYFAMKHKTSSCMITVKVTDKSGNVLGYTNLWPSDYYYELDWKRGFSSKPWWRTEAPKQHDDLMRQMIEEDRKRDEEELAQRIEIEELSEQKSVVYKIG